MSRIGKKIRVIPAGVTVEVKRNKFTAKGPKGELSLTIHPHVTLAIEGNNIVTTVANENDKKDRSLWGTFSALIDNMLVGVTTGFSKTLELNGVGYKVAMKGTDLHLELGFSHPVEFKAASGIKFSVDKNVIKIEGIDRQLVGEMAAQIRALKKVEPYKGKGLKYSDEVVRRKAGKTAAKASA